MAYSLTPAFQAPFTNDDVEFQVGTAGAVTLGAITAMNVDTNTTTQPDDGGGIWDTTRTVNSQQPMANFTTKDLTNAIDGLGARGGCLGVAGWTGHAQRHDECEGRATGSVHGEANIANGLIVPTTLTANAGEDATLSVDIHGTTIVTAGVAIAPLTVTYDTAKFASTIPSIFSLGTCRLSIDTDCDNTQDVYLELDDISSVSIEFGVEVKKRVGAGTVWPVYASIMKVRPVITINTIEVEAIHDTLGIPILGAGVLRNSTPKTISATTAIQLRKRSDCDAWVDDATTEHIMIEINGLAYATSVYSSTGQEDATTALRIEGTATSTSLAPMILNTNAAYVIRQP